MTEEQWRKTDNPYLMVDLLRDRPFDRKLRLFACAYCRRLCNFAPSYECSLVINAMESFANGLITAEEKEAVCTSVAGCIDAPAIMDFVEDCANTTDGWAAADFVVRAVRRLADVTEEWPIQAELLREIVGNPFHPTPLSLKPSTTNEHSTAFLSSPMPSKMPDVLSRTS